MTDARHAPFWVVGAASFVVGFVPLALHARLDDPKLLAGAFTGWAVAMFLLAACGGLIAATTFAPGDQPRPGWLLLAGGYLVLVPARLAVGSIPDGLYEAAVSLDDLRSLASVVSTAAELAGLVLLGRAWRSSGLDEGTPAARLLLRLVSLAVAAALAGPDLVRQLPAALHGDTAAWADVVTDVLDGAVFVVAVPVLRAALTLGGGLVAWPWAFLTASVFGWLLYDALAAYGAVLTPRVARTLEEVCRTWACGFALTAGIAQRWVLGAPPGAAPQASAAPHLHPPVA
jgi:hypothetical protein